MTYYNIWKWRCQRLFYKLSSTGWDKLGKSLPQEVQRHPVDPGVGLFALFEVFGVDRPGEGGFRRRVVLARQRPGVEIGAPQDLLDFQRKLAADWQQVLRACLAEIELLQDEDALQLGDGRGMLVYAQVDQPVVVAPEPAAPARMLP